MFPTNRAFAYDAWYGIYDTSVTAEQLKNDRGSISQGAWGYVVPKGDDIHSTALNSASRLDSGRITFTFNSKALVSAADGKTNPTAGGTYNLFLFYTDHGSDQYTVARS